LECKITILYGTGHTGNLNVKKKFYLFYLYPFVLKFLLLFGIGNVTLIGHQNGQAKALCFDIITLSEVLFDKKSYCD
jgi:hypothetical protein